MLRHLTLCGKNWLRRFRRRFYTVQPLEETDRILRDQLGITLGGQLGMATVAQLRESLQVEGLLYGTLMDYGETTTGLVNVRKVRGKFKLVETRPNLFSGKMVSVSRARTHPVVCWEAYRVPSPMRAVVMKRIPWVVIESRSSNRGILDGLAAGLASKLVSKALGVHLERETDEMIWRLVQNLPWGAGDVTGAVLVATPMPACMPKIEMPPPPAIGHMDYGDRDFKALMVSTTFDKSQGAEFSFDIPIAKAGEKFRMEMDYAKMSGAEGMPAAMSSVVMIHREDEKRTYSLLQTKRNTWSAMKRTKTTTRNRMW